MANKWKDVRYLRKGESFEYEYNLFLPEPLADWDVFDYWERARVLSMRDNLNQNDVLFDVGAEMGWLSVVYASFCKVFLIEPTVELWPNIYQIWTKNRKEQPVGCFNGLVGAKSKNNSKPYFYEWPESSYGELIDKNKYQYLDNNENLPVMTIDDLVKHGFTSLQPTALTIDIEGYELYALQGAKKLLAENNIKVWISVHPDLANNIGIGENEVDDFMYSLGYTGQLLGVDHEYHYLYLKS